MNDHPAIWMSNQSFDHGTLVVIYLFLTQQLLHARDLKKHPGGHEWDYQAQPFINLTLDTSP